MGEEKMTKLEIAKKIIRANIKYARCGIYNTRNILGDEMKNLYHHDGLIIDICYRWRYFEVFGLTNEDFKELEMYYEERRRE